MEPNPAATRLMARLCAFLVVGTWALFNFVEETGRHLIHGRLDRAMESTVYAFVYLIPITVIILRVTRGRAA